MNDVDPDAADAVAEACRAHSPGSRAVPFDVSDSSAVRAVFATLESDWGTLDVLVNNAGVSATTDAGVPPELVFEPMKRPITEITDEHWRRMLGVHLDAWPPATRWSAGHAA